MFRLALSTGHCLPDEATKPSCHAVCVSGLKGAYKLLTMTMKIRRQGCGVTYYCYPSHLYHFGEQYSDSPWGNHLPPIQNHVASRDVTSGSKDEHETLALSI